MPRTFRSMKEPYRRVTCANRQRTGQTKERERSRTTPDDTVGLIDPLQDFDHADAALAIAAMVPGSRFARAVAKGIGTVDPLSGS